MSHTLTLTADAPTPEEIEDGYDPYDDYDYAITCSGVTEFCRAWWECTTCTDAIKAADDPEQAKDDLLERISEDEEAHGVPHMWLDFKPHRYSDDCLLHTLDSVCDAVDELVRVEKLAIPGEYEIDIDDCDYDTVYLALAAVSSGVSGTAEPT